MSEGDATARRLGEDDLVELDAAFEPPVDSHPLTRR
jgi:hypothetical protein